MMNHSLLSDSAAPIAQSGVATRLHMRMRRRPIRSAIRDRIRAPKASSEIHANIRAIPDWSRRKLFAINGAPTPKVAKAYRWYARIAATANIVARACWREGSYGGGEPRASCAPAAPVSAGPGSVIDLSPTDARQSNPRRHPRKAREMKRACRNSSPIFSMEENKIGVDLFFVGHDLD